MPQILPQQTLQATYVTFAEIGLQQNVKTLWYCGFEFDIQFYNLPTTCHQHGGYLTWLPGRHQASEFVCCQPLVTDRQHLVSGHYAGKRTVTA